MSCDSSTIRWRKRSRTSAATGGWLRSRGDGPHLQVEVVERALHLLLRLVALDGVFEECAQPGEHLKRRFVVLVPGREVAVDWAAIVEIAQVSSSHP